MLLVSKLFIVALFIQFSKTVTALLDPAVPAIPPIGTLVVFTSIVPVTIRFLIVAPAAAPKNPTLVIVSSDVTSKSRFTLYPLPSKIPLYAYN